MKQLLLYLMVIIGLLGCGEETYYPSGLRGYQVERLLTGGAKKHWFVTATRMEGTNQPIESCADSIWWVFDQVSNDSIATYRLKLDNNCLMYDTTFIGALFASGGEKFFNDTVYFERANGTSRYALIDRVTSEVLRLDYLEGGNEFEVNLDPVPARLLPRQVPVLLAGGGPVGSFQDWKLTSLSRGGSNVRIPDCEDTTIFRFEVSNSLFELREYTQDTLCQLDELTFFGDLDEIGVEEGYFNNQLTLSGGGIDGLQFTTLSSTQFQATYDTITVSYRLVID